MMRETSSTSSTICVKDVTFRATVSMARICFSPVSRPDCIMRTYPTIAFSGVRSSWDSVARNSSFSRLASRAIAKQPLPLLLRPLAVADVAGDLRRADHGAVLRSESARRSTRRG